VIRAFLYIMAAVAAIVPTAAAEEKREMKALSGPWVVEKAEMDGTDITKALKVYVLILDGDKYTLVDNGKTDKGTVTVDASKTPKEMDITGGPDSPHQGKTFPCIYEVTDGKLTVCYGMDYKTRPTEFKATPDSKRMLAVYKPK